MITPEPGPGPVARAIRARRLEMGLSVEDAALQARIHVTSWRLIEHGTVQPSPLVIGVMCRVLEWTPATIESLTVGELHLDDDGGAVVDLNRWPALPAAGGDDLPAADAPAPALDLKGLTPAQLAEVQSFIDDLRDYPDEH